jgi:hypothetical protein
VGTVWMDGDDEEIGRWGLVKGGEIEVCCTRIGRLDSIAGHGALWC